MKKLTLLLGIMALALPLVVLAYSGSAWGAGKEGSGKEHRDEAKKPCQAETLRDKANPLRGASKSLRMKVTAYCMPAGQHGRKSRTNGPDGTSSGAPLEIGVAAANPNHFPFGTVLRVPGYGEVTVRDTVGDRRSDHLDIFVGRGILAEKLADNWGVRSLDVEIVKLGKKKRNCVLAEE